MMLKIMEKLICQMPLQVQRCILILREELTKAKLLWEINQLVFMEFIKIQHQFTVMHCLELKTQE